MPKYYHHHITTLPKTPQTKQHCCIATSTKPELTYCPALPPQHHHCNNHSAMLPHYFSTTSKTVLPPQHQCYNISAMMPIPPPKQHHQNCSNAIPSKPTQDCCPSFTIPALKQIAIKPPIHCNTVSKTVLHHINVIAM